MSTNSPAAALILAALVSLTASKIPAQRLLVDLLPGTDLSRDANPSGFQSFGGRVLFAAQNPPTLFETDGTTAGTRPFDTGDRVLSVPPGAANGLLFFAAPPAGGGNAVLWRSDGTAGGTFALHSSGRSFAPGSTSNGQLFYVHDDGTRGTELWVTDGSVAGTRMVVELVPGSTGSVLERLTPTPTGLFLVWRDPAFVRRLVRTDGTPAGTVVFNDSVNPVDLTPAAGGLYYRAVDPAAGLEIHYSDGTAAGTGVAIDLVPGTNGSVVDVVGALGNQLVFFFGDGSTGSEPWVTDRTTAGTGLLADLNPGMGSSRLYQDGAAADGLLWFTADDGTHGFEPWVTDGTTAGTRLVGDLHPGPASSFAASFTAALGGTVFAATTATHGSEPWRAGPGATAPALLADVEPGAAGSSPSLFFARGPQLFFSADTAANGREPWVSDGTTIGTALLTDLAAFAPGSDPFDLRVAGSRVVFLGRDPQAFVERLYGTDGTAAGTFELILGLENFTLGKGVEFLGDLWLTAERNRRADFLLRTDGTIAGTTLMNLPGTATVGGTAKDLAVSNGLLYFPGIERDGTEPWVTDGTTAGTRQIADLVPGSFDSDPTGFSAVSGGVVFVAAFPATRGTPRGLGFSDGSAANTQRILELPNRASLRTTHPLVSNGSLTWFAMSTAAEGQEIWQTDGTVAGTFALDLVPGSGGSSPDRLTPLGQRLVFAANLGTGFGLYAWDPATSGLQTLIAPGVSTASGNPFGALTVAGSRAWLQVTGIATVGTEPWTTDGTPAGTRLVRDLEPGPGSSLPMIAPIPGTSSVLVSVLRPDTSGDPQRGARDTFYVSDGTFGGTRLIGSLGRSANGQRRDSDLLVAQSSWALLRGDDGITGLEPWVLDLGPDQASASSYGLGCADSSNRVPRLLASEPPTVGSASFALRCDRGAMTAPNVVFLAVSAQAATATCQILVDLQAVGAQLANTDAAGRANLPLGLPNDPALIGSTVFCQWLVVDSTAASGLGFTLSPGLQLDLGR